MNMPTIGENLLYYALGKKGHTHKVKYGVLKENKNVTNVQNYLGKNAKYLFGSSQVDNK